MIAPSETEIIAGCVHFSIVHRDAMIEAARKVGRLRERDDGAAIVDMGDRSHVLDEFFVVAVAREYLQMLGSDVPLERIARTWFAMSDREIDEPTPVLLNELHRLLEQAYAREDA